MDRYYFNLFDGVRMLVDGEGRMLAGPGAVAATALVEVRALIGMDALTGYISLAQRLDIEDERHALVHRLVFADAVTVVGRNNVVLSANR